MTKPCATCGARPKMKGRQKCGWCWIAKQPIAVQVRAADQRLAAAQSRQGFVRRVRIKPELWPEGHRWCAGCQAWVPLTYVGGSRCKACSSRDKHASMVKSTYQLDPAVYAALLKWQGGRCYVCRQVPRSRRMAVDHDHACCPGETSCGQCVRGLLCSGDEWGCNHAVVGLVERVDDPLGMARRLVAYLESPPLARMQAGEEGLRIATSRPQADEALLGRPMQPGDTPAPF